MEAVCGLVSFHSFVFHPSLLAQFTPSFAPHSSLLSSFLHLISSPSCLFFHSRRLFIYSLFSDSLSSYPVHSMFFFFFFTPHTLHFIQYSLTLYPLIHSTPWPLLHVSFLLHTFILFIILLILTLLSTPHPPLLHICGFGTRVASSDATLNQSDDEPRVLSSWGSGLLED